MFVIRSTLSNKYLKNSKIDLSRIFRNKWLSTNEEEEKLKHIVAHDAYTDVTTYKLEICLGYSEITGCQQMKKN